MAIGRPAGMRLATAERLQKKWDVRCLDDLLGPDHMARQVWAYVEGLDLSVFYGRVRTTVRSSGRSPIDPKILMSLWLYATLDGWAARGFWTGCAGATRPISGCAAMSG